MKQLHQQWFGDDGFEILISTQIQPEGSLEKMVVKKLPEELKHKLHKSDFHKKVVEN